MDIWTAKQIIDGAAADLEKFGPTHGSVISHLVADRLQRLSKELEGTGHLTAPVGLRYDYNAKPTEPVEGIENGEQLRGYVKGRLTGLGESIRVLFLSLDIRHCSR